MYLILYYLQNRQRECCHQMKQYAVNNLAIQCEQWEILVLTVNFNRIKSV